MADYSGDTPIKVKVNDTHITIKLNERGLSGADGASAYDLAVSQGFVGTLEEWLASLQGADGKDGSGLVASVNNQTGNIVLTPDHIGLWNLNNTKDINKLPSLPVQDLLDLKQDVSTPAQRLSMLGIFIGTVAPTLKTFAQWCATGTGYWAWIDISNEAVSNDGAGVLARIRANAFTEELRGVGAYTDDGMALLAGVIATPSVKAIGGVGLTIGAGAGSLTGVSVTASVSATAINGYGETVVIATVVGVTSVTSVAIIGGTGASAGALFSETFNSDTLGQFTLIGGSVPVSSGQAQFDALTDSIRVPLSLSTASVGKYIELICSMPYTGDFVGSGFKIAVSSSSAAQQTGEYSFNPQQWYDSSYSGAGSTSQITRDNNIQIAYAEGNSFVNPVSTEFTLRLEITSAGQLTIKVNDVTKVTVNNTLYNTFNYLWIRGNNSGATSYVNSIEVGNI